MRHVFFLLAAALAFAPSAPAGERSMFNKIAPEAQLANGSWQIQSYDKRLGRRQLEEQSKKELAHAYWENCGPWKSLTSRRAVIQDIKQLEDMVGESNVPKRLQALYDQGKIVAAVGAISNNEVECSLHWFHIYGSDGTRVQLLYNTGD